MKAMIRHIDDHGVKYDALAFCCPGCAESSHNSGLHILAVNATNHSPSWDWDGNLEAPTLNPSILSRSGWQGQETVCHSYLRAGVFEFLSDCTHSMAGQHVPMLDLPEWFVDRGDEQ